ncbi:hypothetical protein [Tepidibacter mesophilus]|uniref:hypothetical protein n=1 Tax=Tepidibacter mesophilus TaxID=655607 RepID=UPI000C07C146|nr:hypothetical protein [Tepidibacter mesophilus]
MKLPLKLMNIFGNNMILDADENILEIKDNRENAEEIVKKVNTFDVLDKELCRLEDKEKRLKEENAERKMENDILLKHIADIKKAYIDLLSKEHSLMSQNREYIELLGVANEYIKENLEEGCLTAEIDELLEKAKSNR